MNKKITEGQIAQIISRIDNLKDDELNNEFIRLNPNSRDDFKKIFFEAVDQTPEKRHASISSSIHKGLLKKKPPITSMLQYFKTIVYKIDKIHDTITPKDGLITKENEYTINLLEFDVKIAFLRSMINTLVLDIEKGYDAIITVDLNNSKELLLKEFDDFISRELRISPIYDERKKIHLQNAPKLRLYLKAWELQRAGLTFSAIATLIDQKESTVKIQFRKAFEFIYGFKYSKEKFIELVVRRGNRKTCDDCPKKGKGCEDLCNEINKDLRSFEKPLREELYGNQFIDNAYMEFDDILSDDNLDMDNEIDPEASSG